MKLIDVREYEMMALRSESVAWEGDHYSQVMGKDKDGYVRGLGLGPTPKEVWELASLSKWKGVRLTTSNKETAGVKELCMRTTIVGSKRLSNFPRAISSLLNLILTAQHPHHGVVAQEIIEERDRQNESGRDPNF
ncbi:hypothetical protein Ancab_039888 [Ancistrocladus abbreviatus]